MGIAVLEAVADMRLPLGVTARRGSWGWENRDAFAAARDRGELPSGLVPRAAELGLISRKVFQLVGMLTGRKGRLSRLISFALHRICKFFRNWRARQDSNLRPLAPEANALSS